MTQEIRAGDVMFSVEDAGTGAPVVFIHGWSMSGRFFQRQLAYFAGTHRVIIPDLRGHGRSEKTTRGHTVPNYAADLHAILAGLSVERPVLVGWSMGAMVGYEYLRAFGPDSVAGLVIVDQPPSDFAWDGYESGVIPRDALRDYREFLPQIGVPTLVLFGEDDKLTSPKAGRYIADRVPGARLQTFPGSSHCPFWEEADAFNQAVAAFAAEVTG